MYSIDFGQQQANSFGEQYYTGLSQLLFAKQSAETVFTSNYKGLLEKEEGLTIFIGTDSGLLYHYLKKKRLKPNQKFILIEFAEVIEKLGLYETAQEWSGSVRLVDESFDFSKLAAKEFETYLVRRKVALAQSLSVSDARAGSAYKLLFDKVQVDFQTFYSPHLVSQNAKQFERARLINAVDNITPLSQCENRLEGATALIVGGGPTLDDSIEWIRNNQERLIIFAAGRVAARLARENIKPDFFVSVDPQEESFDNTKGILTFKDQSTLISSYHVSPKVLAQWPGATTYAGLKYGWANLEYIKNIEIPGPTVTNAALGAAFSLGCSQFILAGVDFCFAYGRTHESSSDEAKIGAHLQHRAPFEVLNNAGEIVKTEYGYAHARENMEKFVAYYLNKDSTLTFKSLGLASAKMENVEYTQSAGIELPIFNKVLVEELRQELLVDRRARKQYAQKTLDELKKQKQHFLKIKLEAKEALTLLPKLYVEGSDTPKFKVMNRLQKMRKKVNRLIGEDGDLLINYDTSFYYDSFKPVEDEKNIKSDEVTAQFSGFFNGIISSIDAYILIIDEGKERALLRLNELDSSFQPCDLFTKWQELDEYGRALRWQQWHEKVNLESNQIDCLNQALGAFKHELGVTETKQVARLKKRSHDPLTFLTRAQVAITSKDLREILDLKNHLDKIEDQDAQQDLTKLLGAMEQELNDNLEKAQTLYDSTVQPTYRHVALKRMLQISMDQRDHETSLKLLEDLCRYSLDYMVSYADLLDLIGQKKMSAEVLKMYLLQIPGKQAVQLKLAHRLMELGQNQDASQALQEVLSVDPSNSSAKALLEQIT